MFHSPYWNRTIAQYLLASRPRGSLVLGGVDVIVTPQDMMRTIENVRRYGKRGIDELLLLYGPAQTSEFFASMKLIADRVVLNAGAMQERQRRRETLREAHEVDTAIRSGQGHSRLASEYREPPRPHPQVGQSMQNLLGNDRLGSGHGSEAYTSGTPTMFPLGRPVELGCVDPAATPRLEGVVNGGVPAAYGIQRHERSKETRQHPYTPGGPIERRAGSAESSSSPSTASGSGLTLEFLPINQVSKSSTSGSVSRNRNRDGVWQPGVGHQRVQAPPLRDFGMIPQVPMLLPEVPMGMFNSREIERNASGRGGGGADTLIAYSSRSRNGRQ